MTVTFTPSELDQITQWYNQASAQGNRSAMYLGIAGLLQQKLQGASVADQQMLNQDILWFQGASQANLGNGIYATLIRSYTQAQATLRMGGSISDDEMQLASNRVGDAVYNTIQQMQGSIPTLTDIAHDDATAVGITIFQPVIPDDSASTRNTGWSGTVLFSMLGLDETSMLVTNGSTVQSLDDARNVLLLCIP